ncbi:MAG: cysteine synthase [Pelagibacterium sp. SCN 63-23]|nr:MAG: cysteine synthase [Pelagibacterium sp. SCN 63-23]
MLSEQANIAAVPDIDCPARAWTRQALVLLEAEGRRSADTHLIPLPVKGFEDTPFYFKDESSHPTGSLKHRLARSLFLYGICNGLIRQGTTLTEASSGSTAVSEAYYARMLGLDFIAVLPATTSPSKIEAITRQGGKCHLVEDGGTIYQVAAELARETGGYYLDQFTFAERATDWRGNNNIAESIFRQMDNEPHSVPSWVVMGAGTGGTAATIGRYIRYRGYKTRLCVADVEYSAFYEGWCRSDAAARCSRPSRIEGVGRPRVEKSFMPGVVDHMIKVPDAASLAAMRVLSRQLGRRVGGSTGTNFYGLCWAADQMRRSDTRGSLVTLICDSGERYADTYYNDAWLAEQGIELAPHIDMLEAFLDGSGDFRPGLL